MARRKSVPNLGGLFVASLLMSGVGATGLFAFTAIAHGLLFLFVVMRMMQRVSAPDEKHISFSDALATAHTASQVYEEEFQHNVEMEEQKTG